MVDKIVSKCLYMRIKPMLAKIISVTQSALVGGRLIFNNVIVGFECIMRFKLDMSKAYD